MKKRGFTIVETMIVITISVSMLIALIFLLFNFNTISTYQKNFMQSSNSASLLVREVESLTFPAHRILQTHTFSSGTHTSSSTALVLEIPSIDISGNTIANTYDYAAFYTTGTNTYRLLEVNASSKRASGTKQLSATTQTLTFTYSDVDFTKAMSVTIALQTQMQIKGETVADTRGEQIRLRNY